MSGPFATIVAVAALVAAHLRAAAPDWELRQRCRVQLAVDGRLGSNQPASIEIDFQQALRTAGLIGTWDEGSVEVRAAGQRSRIPHRVDPLFGAGKAVLNFSLPNPACTNVLVYFDTLESRRRGGRTFHGLVGDGDKFVEAFGRREMAPSHFDCLADLDGDGDLDLFKGGVEPFVRCWENVGRNRFVARGRLASGGELLKLPCSRANRSWVTVAFHDLDGDGDLDFIPSFGDGPDIGRFIAYRNTTREHGGVLTFERAGTLESASGVPLASGAQAGGWFPSIALVKDWDADGLGPDALVGSNHRCWLYRRVGTNAAGLPVFGNGEAVRADGREITLINPRFDAADIDQDGDLDLFAGTQPGAVHWFENGSTPGKTRLLPGRVIAWDGKYIIGDAHSGVVVADLDGDALPDVLSGRFWERKDLNGALAGRDFGGLWKNTGSRSSPRFERHSRNAPFTENFQPCDAIRQNGVRATDWNGDGRMDLLAGDTDGYIWFFRNEGRDAFAWFAEAVRVWSGEQALSVAGSGGHARFDVCDWNRDGRKDLVVADGSGAVHLLLGEGRRNRTMGKGQRVAAGGKPIQLSSRASVLVCDWDNDGRQDLVLADDKGYYFSRNTGADGQPVLSAPAEIRFGGKRVGYVRPNLGSFVDWDGDGKRDLIGCHFENSIRFYRNIGFGAAGEEPQFADPEGIVILQGESPQMISGADAVDWNGDGDLDLLTGQGHGGSGLRFFERDWIEAELRRAQPKVFVLGVQTRR